MGAQLDRAVAALCMGRSRKAVAAEVAAVIAAAPALWFAMCIFIVLEPLP